MSSCAEHDPITRAGPLTCASCSAESYPGDAAWLDNGTILAAYTSTHKPACPAPAVYGIVILVPGGTGLLPPVQRPRKCHAIAVSTGSPCKNRSVPGSVYCRQHDECEPR
jgi:hypothetical protein